MYFFMLTSACIYVHTQWTCIGQTLDLLLSFIPVVLKTTNQGGTYLVEPF